MLGGRGIEGLRFTHPLRHEPLPTGFRHDPVVCRALVLLARSHDRPLAVQRAIRILNNNFLDVMMGSMECRRLAGRGQVLKYLARYTHRVAISNSCLAVHFRWRTKLGPS